jgi:hypothetical protein
VGIVIHGLMAIANTPQIACGTIKESGTDGRG